jgi:amidase
LSIRRPSQEDAVWIEREVAPPAGTGPLVAVKDLIDVAGSVTTAGCRAVADRGLVASADAACVAAVRANGGRLAGKVNLHELAFGVSGVNPWFGTPANPIDPGRVPGGSSSGSAVAAALGLVEVALGSDTGGSVRIPAACCGVVGLKTTYGRIPLDGVWPLAPSYDSVGPLGATVSAVAEGMRLLLGSFELAPATALPGEVGRLQLAPDWHVDPVYDAAVDRALQEAGLSTVPVSVDGWLPAWRDHQRLLGAEAVESDGWLLEETGGLGIGPETLDRLHRSVIPLAERDRAAASAQQWAQGWRREVRRLGVVALPTLPYRPPPLGEPTPRFNLLTAPMNLAGLPAIALPVPSGVADRPPASLQLVGPPGSEEVLVGLAALVEAAVAR